MLYMGPLIRNKEFIIIIIIIIRWRIRSWMYPETVLILYSVNMEV